MTRTTGVVARRHPSLTLPELWVFLAVALPIVASLLAPMSTVDLAYQVRAGQLMLQSGSILRVDPFTFTAAGSPWLDQQWLAQVVLAGLFNLGGWALLAGLRAALVGAIFVLVYRTARDAGASQRLGAGLTLAAFALAAPALALRPQLLGMLLFALTLWLVGRRRAHAQSAWLVVPVVVLWANVHGSFFFGPAILVVAWLQGRRGGVRRGQGTLLAAVLATAAATLNPWGLGVWAYAFGLSVDPTIRRLLVEWQVTNPLGYVGALFYLSVAATAVALAIAHRLHPWRSAGDLPWPEILWLAALGAVGAYAERGVVWWALGAAPVVAGVLAERFGRDVRAERAGSRSRAERPSRANAAIALAIVVAAILALPWWRAGTPSSGALPLLADAPTGIAAALSTAMPADRIFAPQPLGSWLELADPGVPVFVDSRIEIFPTAVWDDYQAVFAGAPGWQAILDRWKVTLVVATPADQAGLAARLRAEPGWQLHYTGPDGEVFSRR